MKKGSAVDIPAKHIYLLFQCVRCKDTPMSPPVHICPAGHQSCHRCYMNCNLECVLCRQPFVGCNETVEMVIQRLSPIAALKLSHLTTGSDDSPDEDLEQYDPELLANLERAHYESLRNAKLADDSSRNVQVEVLKPCLEPSEDRSSEELYSVTLGIPQGSYTTASSDDSSVPLFKITPFRSYAPVQCPIQSCGKIIVGSAFINHYETLHVTVPILSAAYNTPSCEMSVDLMTFEDHTVQCLAMFLIPKELPVSPSLLKISSDSEVSTMEKLQIRKRLMLCLVLLSKLTYVSENPGGSAGDGGDTCFLAWAACLYDKPPVYYTITAGNSGERLRSVTYCGPIGTLHDSQDPHNIFKRGDCLVVSPGLLKKLSSPTSCLNISVTFHPIVL